MSKLKKLSVMESLIGLVFLFLLLCVVMAAITRSIGVSDNEIRDKAMSLARAKLQTLTEGKEKFPSPYTCSECFLGGRIIRVVKTSDHQTDPLVAEGMQKIVVTAIWINLDGTRGRQNFIDFVNNNIDNNVVKSTDDKIQTSKQHKEIL